MIWKNREGSDNVEDRRGGAKGLKGGVGSLVIVAVVTYFMSGGDMNAVIKSVLNSAVSTHQSAPTPKVSAEAPFVSVVLKDTEDVWHHVLAKHNRRYIEPKLVLFDGSTSSACGLASEASGPFYCPADRKIYIDLAFFRALEDELGAKGDFAKAYVIAHEVGHHVQNLLGILNKTDQMRRNLSQTKANQVSVRVELQADCFAGLWAHQADKMKNILESGDIEEGMNAASQVGDDTLQKRSRGYAVPDSFTHGSSTERLKWFKRGYQYSTISECNTFTKYL